MRKANSGRESDFPKATETARLWARPSQWSLCSRHTGAPRQTRSHGGEDHSAFTCTRPLSSTPSPSRQRQSTGAWRHQCEVPVSSVQADVMWLRVGTQDGTQALTHTAVCAKGFITSCSADYGAMTVSRPSTQTSVTKHHSSPKGGIKTA